MLKLSHLIGVTHPCWTGLEKRIKVYVTRQKVDGTLPVTPTQSTISEHHSDENPTIFCKAFSNNLHICLRDQLATILLQPTEMLMISNLF